MDKKTTAKVVFWCTLVGTILMTVVKFLTQS